MSTAARITPLILFVSRFDQCLRFYQKVFGLTPIRIYRGKGHPRWAELHADGLRFCLHGNYRGPRYRSGEPLALHFNVPDISATIRKIRAFGGTVRRPPRRYDYRPAELQVALATSFRDPDGNLFELQQVLEEFSSVTGPRQGRGRSPAT